jgi:hypothetical protein
MTDSSVAAKVHQAFDVHGDLASQVALNRVLGDFGAKLVDSILGKVLDLGVSGDTRCSANLRGKGTADTVDRRQGNYGVLPLGNVDTGNTSHVFLPPDPLYARPAKTIKYIAIS